MSSTTTTDLQLSQALPKLSKLSPLRILTQQDYGHQEQEEDAGLVIIQQDEAIPEELCKTPTSEEHRIPEILCCPKAPKKPKTRRSSLSCKRKLIPADGFPFFEILNRDEVDDFFRPNLVVKRRRQASPSCK